MESHLNGLQKILNYKLWPQVHISSVENVLREAWAVSGLIKLRSSMLYESFIEAWRRIRIQWNKNKKEETFR